MQPDAAALLWDARRAAGRISEFVAGHDWPAYRDDVLVRSAVERQSQILGEALGRLARVDPETASLMEDLPRIVAIRNVLVHGYAVVDDALVWEVATVSQRAPSPRRARLDAARRVVVREVTGDASPGPRGTGERRSGCWSPTGASRPKPGQACTLPGASL